MKVFFVRHGQTNYNISSLCNENPAVDVHLTEAGKEQVRAVAEKLRNIRFDLVIVSELPRTRETAAIITQDYEVALQVEPRLNDRKTGMEGKPVTDFFAAIGPDVFQAKLPGGESFQEEKARVASFLEELKSRAADNVLVVSHSEIMQIIKGYFLVLSDEQMYGTRIDNGEVLEFDL